MKIAHAHTAKNQDTAAIIVPDSPRIKDNEPVRKTVGVEESIHLAVA